MRSENAKAGVDYKLIDPFKARMREVARETRMFPHRWGVDISHGMRYVGPHEHSWLPGPVIEGLGNKSLIAAILYAKEPNGPTYHDCIIKDAVRMASNDAIASGAMCVTLADEIVAGSSEFFADERRREDIARGLYEACESAGMALVQGESASYKYLVNPRYKKLIGPTALPAVFSSAVMGIYAPVSRMIDKRKLKPGDVIVGIQSSGIHANGISVIMRKAMDDRMEDQQGLPDELHTKMPSGKTVGEAVMVPTICYASLVDRLFQNSVDVHAYLPGTGGGVAKLCNVSDKSFTYKISKENWLSVPELMLYMNEIGVSLRDCITTFNWGVGYYVFVDKKDADKVVDIARQLDLQAAEVGVVEEGQRGVIFGPENDLWIPPPGH